MKCSSSSGIDPVTAIASNWFLVPHHESILRPKLDIAEFELFNLFFRVSREVFVDVDADDGTHKLCETRGQEARAGADLEDVIAGFQAKRLQQTTLYFRSQHLLTVGERNLHIGERQVTVSVGDEGLSRNVAEGAQDAVVQDFPGADLLSQHLGPRFFKIHCFTLDLAVADQRYG